MKTLNRRFTFFVNLSICFVLSDITVFICHVRNPYLGFLNSTASYVLYTLTGIVFLITLVLDLKLRKKRKMKAAQRQG